LGGTGKRSMARMRTMGRKQEPDRGVCCVWVVVEGACILPLSLHVDVCLYACVLFCGVYRGVGGE